MCVCVCVQHQNFEEQMQGMKTQLIQLSTLLRLLDLAFWNYLGNGSPHRPTGRLSVLEVPSDSASFPSHRVSGLGLLVLLLPLAADPVQEGAQLHGRAAALGGEFTRGTEVWWRWRVLLRLTPPSPPPPRLILR